MGVCDLAMDSALATDSARAVLEGGTEERVMLDEAVALRWRGKRFWKERV